MGRGLVCFSEFVVCDFFPYTNIPEYNTVVCTCLYIYKHIRMQIFLIAYILVYNNRVECETAYINDIKCRFCPAPNTMNALLRLILHFVSHPHLAIDNIVSGHTLTMIKQAGVWLDTDMCRLLICKRLRTEPMAKHLKMRLQIHSIERHLLKKYVFRVQS